MGQICILCVACNILCVMFYLNIHQWPVRSWNWLRVLLSPWFYYFVSVLSVMLSLYRPSWMYVRVHTFAKVGSKQPQSKQPSVDFKSVSHAHNPLLYVSPLCVCVCVGVCSRNASLTRMCVWADLWQCVLVPVKVVCAVPVICFFALFAFNCLLSPFKSDAQFWIPKTGMENLQTY